VLGVLATTLICSNSPQVKVVFEQMQRREPMAVMQKILDVEKIRHRAAAIRRNWSPSERHRRTGLPPDLPPRLRQFILSERSAAWTTAPVESREKMRVIC
jgi:hypothetical protein